MPQPLTPAVLGSIVREARLADWLIGGTDAHAKNFALLHGAPGDVRLARLYDVISSLAYPSLGGTSGSLAMAIHGERVIDRLNASLWRGRARAVGFAPTYPPERALTRLARA